MARKVKVTKRARPAGTRGKGGNEKGKLVLVTGACGFSGMHMVKLLREEGFRRIRATDLQRTFDNPKLRTIRREMGVDLDSPGVEFVPSDLTDRASLRRAVKGAEWIFHPASLYDYSAPMEALVRVNIDGATNLCEEIVAAGTVERMIHWSTAGVYGHPYMPKSYFNPVHDVREFVWGIFVRPWVADPTYKRPGKHPTNQPFTEESSNPLNTPEDGPSGTYLVNDYSITKWKQEKIVQRYQKEKGLPATIIRPAPLYGPGSDYGIGGIVVAISEGLVPDIPRDLDHFLMVNCHVRDGCRAALFLARRPDVAGEAFNVIDDSLISQGEFLRSAALLVGRKLHKLPLGPIELLGPMAIGSAKLVQWMEKRFPRYRRLRIWEESSARYVSCSYWISNRKLRQLGFQWEYPEFRVGLKDMVEWFIRVGWIQ